MEPDDMDYDENLERFDDREDDDFDEDEEHENQERHGWEQV